MLFRSVGGITYQYNNTYQSWTRVSSGINVAVVQTANLSVGTSLGLTNTEEYDLDDVSYLTDGFLNTFPLRYNGAYVAVTNPWNLAVSVNGVPQPAFKYNGDIAWASYVLTASRGFTLDPTGNLRFADSIPANSTISIRLQPGTNTQQTKFYPFKPVDILLG